MGPASKGKPLSQDDNCWSQLFFFISLVSFPSNMGSLYKRFPQYGMANFGPWSTFTPHMGFLLKGPTDANFSSINKLELTLSKNLCQKQSLIMDFFRQYKKALFNVYPFLLQSCIKFVNANVNL